MEKKTEKKVGLGLEENLKNLGGKLCMEKEQVVVSEGTKKSLKRKAFSFQKKKMRKKGELTERFSYFQVGIEVLVKWVLRNFLG